MADPPLNRQNSAVGNGGHRFERRFFLCKTFVNDPARGCLHPGIDDLAPPCVELGVEIADIAERTGQEEVLPDVAERTLNLALGLRPVRFAGPRRRALVVQKCHERAVIRDDA